MEMGMSAEDKFRRGLQRAILALGNAKSEPEKATLRQYVRQALENRYLKMIADRQQEVEKLKLSVAKLESDLKRRAFGEGPRHRSPNAIRSTRRRGPAAARRPQRQWPGNRIGDERGNGLRLWRRRGVRNGRNGFSIDSDRVDGSLVFMIIDQIVQVVGK